MWPKWGLCLICIIALDRNGSRINGEKVSQTQWRLLVWQTDKPWHSHPTLFVTQVLHRSGDCSSEGYELLSQLGDMVLLVAARGAHRLQELRRTIRAFMETSLDLSQVTFDQKNYNTGSWEVTRFIKKSRQVSNTVQWSLKQRALVQGAAHLVM